MRSPTLPDNRAHGLVIRVVEQHRHFAAQGVVSAGFQNSGGQSGGHGGVYSIPALPQNPHPRLRRQLGASADHPLRSPYDWSVGVSSMTAFGDSRCLIVHWANLRCSVIHTTDTIIVDIAVRVLIVCQSWDTVNNPIAT